MLAVQTDATVASCAEKLLSNRGGALVAAHGVSAALRRRWFLAVYEMHTKPTAEVGGREGRRLLIPDSLAVCRKLRHSTRGDSG